MARLRTRRERRLWLSPATLATLSVGLVMGALLSLWMGPTELGAVGSWQLDTRQEVGEPAFLQPFCSPA